LPADGRPFTILAVRITLILFLVLLSSACVAQQYSLPRSPTTESLRGLSTPSSKVAWASGTHGTYLRSADGGISWLAAQVPGAEGLDFRDVKAFDAEVAYLLSAGPGDQSRIYKTIDSGRHWTLQFGSKDPRAFFDCMAFWDQQHGIVLGDPIGDHFTLLTTEDGGRTWLPVPSAMLPASLPGEGAFAASGTCIAIQGKGNVWFATGGAAARVFRSPNRGKTWRVEETPILHGKDSCGIFSIAFRDGKHGVVAGGDYKQSGKEDRNLAFTEDGGRTWKPQTLAGEPFVSAVAFNPKRGLLVVGTGQAAYAERDAQRVWTQQWRLSLNAVRFNTADTAIAVGPKGTIVRFTDVP
jgi:photosystem II stability/assembly factor-like uncharacterized protein